MIKRGGLAVPDWWETRRVQSSPAPSVCLFRVIIQRLSFGVGESPSDRLSVCRRTKPGLSCAAGTAPFVGMPLNV